MQNIFSDQYKFRCLLRLVALAFFLVAGAGSPCSIWAATLSSLDTTVPMQPVGIQALAADPACGATIYCGRNTETTSARWYYPTCDSSCGTETWFLRGLPSTIGTYSIVPAVTTGTDRVTISISISSAAPAGNYPFTIGADCSGSRQCNSLDLVLTVLAPSVSIVSEDIRKDEIVVDLKPSKITGMLKVTVVGSKAKPVVYGKNAAGGLGIKIPYGELATPLPASKYSRIDAEWTVNGIKYTSTYNIKFTVLGNTQHTQYNIPHEDMCKGAAGSVTLWSAKSKCTSHNGSYKGDFASQVNLNGTGVPMAGGYSNDEAFCAKASTAKDFRDPGKLTTACGGSSLGENDVAVNLSGGVIACGDSILIVKYKPTGGNIGALKVARDNCPACKKSSPGTVAHIDNFTSDGKCSGIKSLGEFQTILVGK